MADRKPGTPRRRAILTGTAQRVADSVERARGYLKDRPEPSRPPSMQRKSFPRRSMEAEQEATAEPAVSKAESGERDEDGD
jgi:hypothetical protein